MTGYDARRSLHHREWHDRFNLDRWSFDRHRFIVKLPSTAFGQ